MTVQLDFHAQWKQGRDLQSGSYQKQFNLRMTRDTTTFSPDLVIDVSGEETPIDTSHIYSGEIFGEKGTLTHGSVVDGRFEGFIKSHQGTYYIEPSERYLKDQNVPFHSIIYHEDDINYPHKYGSEGGCADHSVYERMFEIPSNWRGKQCIGGREIHWSCYSEEGREQQQRRKTLASSSSRLTTSSSIYYGTREAVIAQISSHVKAIDSIYQGTDFLGIRNIAFMVKRIRIRLPTMKRPN
ncbi:hypothetical protein KUCAC02_002413 [Chaenocephalus aceratus]|uniref:Uncharacterized protein n=1 Tax=Chaenocephalus aceratus TaxID=36190 RepID=A0ACB9XVP9_CHAAC|nr:hypothetical protein KUCAC02_002413 [Chaenocephalus aceratus]